ncbi:MAG TPA: tetratricopeptide repeat protein [Planctomycetota bacterium]|nr:tetratricopeptide repeat protein [Planctomycetota bacterium]
MSHRPFLLAAFVLVGAAGAQEGVLTLQAQAERALAEGRFAAAAEAYLALARAEPDRVAWSLGAAEALARDGRFQDALEHLDGALQRTPGHVGLRVLLAKVNMLHAEELGRGGRRDAHVLFAYQEAAQVARAVVDEHPDERDARLILAEAEFALGNLDAALGEAQAAAERFPHHPGGHIVVAKVWFHRFVAARQRLAGEQPKGKELEQLANEAAAARKATIAAVEAAITADPERAFPHKLLGDVHAWNDNPGQALVCYAKALAIDPNAPVNHDWIGSAARQPKALIHFYQGALDAYRARPDHDERRAATLVWYLGRALFQDKQFAPARDRMRAAYAANPEYANSLHYVWLASYWLGDHDAAEREAAAYARVSAPAFADLLRSLPDRAQTVPILAFLAARAYQGSRIEASAALNHVLALVEDSAEAWNNYAFLCREAGRPQESLTAYEHALALEPDSPQLLNDTAVILHYHLPSPENLARARTMYERAVALAQQQLAGGKLEGADRTRTEQALRDAQANLAKLGGQ